MMKIRMLVTAKGSPDGIDIHEYQAGKKYDLSEHLALIFLNANMAEEDKDMGGPPEVKVEPVKEKAPIKKKRKSRKA